MHEASGFQVVMDIVLSSGIEIELVLQKHTINTFEGDDHGRISWRSS